MADSYPDYDMAVGGELEQPFAEPGLAGVPGDTGAEAGVEPVPSLGGSDLEPAGELPAGEPRFGGESWEPASVFDEEGNVIGATSVEIEY